jgi:glycine/D-amino acid oxidase-like deaminating enzyme
VGYNDGTTTPVLQNIAQRAVRCFPLLANTRVVRSWAALRIMSPDGFPIYQESSSMPGAFLVTCHSGVTLAANHALTIAPWIAGDQKPDAIQAFTANRFHAERTSPLGEEHAH